MVQIGKTNPSTTYNITVNTNGAPITNTAIVGNVFVDSKAVVVQGDNNAPVVNGDNNGTIVNGNNEGVVANGDILVNVPPETVKMFKDMNLGLSDEQIAALAEKDKATDNRLCKFNKLVENEAWQNLPNDMKKILLENVGYPNAINSIVTADFNNIEVTPDGKIHMNSNRHCYDLTFPTDDQDMLRNMTMSFNSTSHSSLKGKENYRLELHSVPDGFSHVIKDPGQGVGDIRIVPTDCGKGSFANPTQRTVTYVIPSSYNGLDGNKHASSADFTINCVNGKDKVIQTHREKDSDGRWFKQNTTDAYQLNSGVSRLNQTAKMEDGFYFNGHTYYEHATSNFYLSNSNKVS